MSEGNAEFVEEFLRKFSDGDMDAVLDRVAPDITWRAAEGAIDDAGELRGREAVRRYVEDWLDMFDDVTIVADELVGAGQDRVVAVQRMSGRAKASGIDAEIRFSVVYTLRGGKIVSGREYFDRADALEAVGLNG
jgi:ketosteroid isomerase-like protein